MLLKIKGILSSIRFWVVTLGFASEYLSQVAVDGFSWEILLTRIGVWLGVVGGIGTADKWFENFKK